MCTNCGTVSRRSFLAGSAALAATFSCAGIARADLPAPPNAIPPAEALKKLVAGNARYVKNRPLEKDFSVDRYARSKSQYPFACILSCADSRVAPELVFDQRPGELFVVRVAGNFVDDYGLASLEYAVKVLGAPLIMVMGHTGCGAVDATIKVVQQKVELPGHLPRLVDAIRPSVEATIAKNPPDLLLAATEANARGNADRLRNAGPIVGPAVQSGKVQVVSALYTLATGKVSLLDKAS